ncbi:conserved hypothetical protein [Aster yellows witches'-broom phytoplasma AYWB]|uniref:Uncharacterized protein n=1 Tax=Aster yellows witches'-broom phytoplasma (strain AYWB) TaxID=322098 RepID=Q2NJU1_AYWBP|nr:hypothetical protein [Aster yellows witches'-broom phytoplasma]ABC65302.1 conserved hypothetical protein [Aster yellows witches'-broom phytoplasma AYWB]
MAKKIIITKKSQPKPPNKPNVKKPKTKSLIKQPPSKKLTKIPIKKSKIIQPQIKTITKSPIIKKPPKQITKNNPKPPKIIVETQQKQDNWFVKIIKKITKPILTLLLITLIGGAIWLIISKFFPESAAKIGPMAKAAWEKTKDLAHYINERGKNFLEWLGFPLKLITYIFNSIIIAFGLILGLFCLGIPVIGPFLGVTILIATAIYTGIIWYFNEPTPKAKTPPPNLVEVYDLDAIKAAEETKLKKDLTEYATKLSQEGKTPKEIEQKINERIEKTKELKKKQLN